jgi:hypothetical protein
MFYDCGFGTSKRFARLLPVSVLNRIVIAQAGAEKGHVVIKYGRIMAITAE